MEWGDKPITEPAIKYEFYFKGQNHEIPIPAADFDALAIIISETEFNEYISNRQFGKGSAYHTYKQSLRNLERTGLVEKNGHYELSDLARSGTFTAFIKRDV